MKPLKRVDL